MISRFLAAAVLLVLPMGCITTRATVEEYKNKIPYVEVTLAHWEW